MTKDEFLARVEKAGALPSRKEAERRLKAHLLAERPRHPKIMRDARETTRVLMREGLIPEPPGA